MSDFDRFKLRRARQGRNHIRTMVFHKLKRDGIHDGSLLGKKRVTKTPEKPRPKYTEILKARRAAKIAAKK